MDFPLPAGSRKVARLLPIIVGESVVEGASATWARPVSFAIDLPPITADRRVRQRGSAHAPAARAAWRDVDDLVEIRVQE